MQPSGGVAKKVMLTSTFSSAVAAATATSSSKGKQQHHNNKQGFASRSIADMLTSGSPRKFLISAWFVVTVYVALFAAKWLRKTLPARKARLERIHKTRAVFTLQCLYRRVLHAQRVKQLRVGFFLASRIKMKLYRVLKQRKSAAVKIQRIFRGYTSRVAFAEQETELRRKLMARLIRPSIVRLKARMELQRLKTQKLTREVHQDQEAISRTQLIRMEKVEWIEILKLRGTTMSTITSRVVPMSVTERRASADVVQDYPATLRSLTCAYVDLIVATESAQRSLWVSKEDKERSELNETFGLLLSRYTVVLRNPGLLSSGTVVNGTLSLKLPRQTMALIQTEFESRTQLEQTEEAQRVSMIYFISSKMNKVRSVVVLQPVPPPSGQHGKLSFNRNVLVPQQQQVRK